MDETIEPIKMTSVGNQSEFVYRRCQDHRRCVDKVPLECDGSATVTEIFGAIFNTPHELYPTGRKP